MISRKRKLALRLATVSLGCLAGIVAAELMLRVFWPVRDEYYLWLPHLKATFRPAPEIVHGVGPEAHLKVNSQGVLGDEWSANRSSEYRIFAVGGSTTQCILLDQSKAWPALVEEGLDRTAEGRKVWVGNGGRPGFSSRDHLGLMRYALDQYDIDAIFMLVGGNDMTLRLVQGNSYDPHFVDDEAQFYDWVRNRFALAPLALSKEHRWSYRRTAVWQMARWIKAGYLSRDIRMDDEGRWLAAARESRRKAEFVDALPPLASALDEYERNIERIVNETRKRSLRIIFLTQPALWQAAMPESEEQLLWMGFLPEKPDQDLSWPWWESGGGRMYTAGALRRAMDSYNQRLLETCSRLQVECVDVAARIPRTREMFFDDLHFTDAGARRVAAELIGYLKAQAPFAETETSHDELGRGRKEQRRALWQDGQNWAGSRTCTGGHACL
jgi:lysophospholipase L1-like esterase